MTGNSYCTTGKIHFEFVKTSIDKCCSVMTHTANLPSSNKNFILQTFRDLPMKCRVAISLISEMKCSVSH